MIDLVIPFDLIDFLSKNKLTFSQFCICLLLYEGNTAKIMKYNAEVLLLGEARIPKEDGSLIREFDDLILKGFITHIGIDISEYYSLDNFMIADKFTKGLIADEYMAEELWNEYPKFGLLGNQQEFNAKVLDYDDFVQKYLKAIKRSAKKHKEVMEKLKAYKKKEKYAEINLSNFIGSRHWENLTDNESEVKLRFH